MTFCNYMGTEETCVDENEEFTPITMQLNISQMEIFTKENHWTCVILTASGQVFENSALIFSMLQWFLTLFVFVVHIENLKE